MVVSSNVCLLPLLGGSSASEDRTAEGASDISSAMEARKPFADTLGDALQTQQGDPKSGTNEPDQAEIAPQEKPEETQSATPHEPADSVKPTDDKSHNEETKDSHKEKPASPAPAPLAIVSAVVANALVTPALVVGSVIPQLQNVTPQPGAKAKGKGTSEDFNVQRPNPNTQSPLPKAQVSVPGSQRPTPPLPQTILPQTALPQKPVPSVPTPPAAVSIPQNGATVLTPMASQQAPVPPQTIPDATVQAVVAMPIPGNPMDSRLVSQPTTPGVEIANLNPVAPAAQNAPQIAMENHPVIAVANAVPTTPPASPALQAAPAAAPAPQIVSQQAKAPETAPPVIAQAAPETVAQTANPTVPAPAVVAEKPNAIQTQEHLDRLRTVGVPEAAPKTPEARTTGTEPTTSPVSAAATPQQQTTKPAESAVQTALPVSPTPDAQDSMPLASPFEATDAAQTEALFGMAVVGNALPTVENPGETVRPPVSLHSVSATANSVVREAATRGSANASSQGQSHEFNDRGGQSGTSAATAVTRPNAELGATIAASEGAPSEIEAASSAATNAPIDRTKLLAQVTQHLETMRFAEGRGEIAFRLNPENLGSLHISVSAHADGVIARVVAEHAGVQQAMEGAKEHLRSALESRGLHLDKLEVSVGQGTLSDGRAASNMSAQQQQAFQERSNFGHGVSLSTRVVEPPIEPAAVSVAAVLKSQSRLDFRA